MNFGEFLQKCTQVKADVLSFKIYQSTEFEFFVVSLITEGQPTSQLEHGKSAKGTPLGFYSATTEKITGGRKKEGDPFDLKESGFYYDSHELASKLGGFRIIANSKKQGDDFLVELNIPVEDAQNLSEENIQIAINRHQELFEKEFRNLIDSFKNI